MSRQNYRHRRAQRFWGDDDLSPLDVRLANACLRQDVDHAALAAMMDRDILGLKNISEIGLARIRERLRRETKRNAKPLDPLELEHPPDNTPFPGARIVDPLLIIGWNMRQDEIDALRLEISRLREVLQQGEVVMQGLIAQVYDGRYCSWNGVNLADEWFKRRDEFIAALQGVLTKPLELGA